MSETSLHLKVEMLNEVNGRLRSENASLRDLVTDYDSVLSTIMSECRYDDDLLAFVDDVVLKALRMRADLLGIEVD